ncbi:MAG: hypothetical protein ACRDRY_17305 [Pseudonocardiaceae bacterium]
MHAATSTKRHVVVNSAAKITQHMQGALRDVLLTAVTSRPAADGGTGSTQFRACATEVLPRIPAEPCTQPLPALAVPIPPHHPGGGPRTGRPHPDHGGTGEHPERFRSRRAPHNDHTLHLGQARYVVLSGRETRVAPDADR